MLINKIYKILKSTLCQNMKQLHNFFRIKQIYILIIGMVLSIYYPQKALSQAPVIPTYNHIVILVLENHSIGQIVDNPYMPYLNSLLPQAAVFSKYYAITHPSQPNYIAMYSGSQQGVYDNLIPANQPFTTPNFGRALIDSGYTFKGYSEDLPYVGFNEASHNLYQRKHAPWTNWLNAPQNGLPDSIHQPFTNFPADFTQLPTVSYVIPHQLHALHDLPNDTTTYQNADNWLQTELDAYIQWCKTNNSLFVLTFDEDNYLDNNHILTFFIGEKVVPGVYNQTLTHYDFLHTLEYIYQLPHFANSSTGKPIDNCWDLCGYPQSVLIGNATICDTTQLIQTYSVTPTNNATYFWKVKGGIILNGQGTETIQVQWISTKGIVDVWQYLP